MAAGWTASGCCRPAAAASPSPSAASATSAAWPPERAIRAASSCACRRGVEGLYRLEVHHQRQARRKQRERRADLRTRRSSATEQQPCSPPKRPPSGATRAPTCASPASSFPSMSAPARRPPSASRSATSARRRPTAAGPTKSTCRSTARSAATIVCSAKWPTPGRWRPAKATASETALLDIPIRLRGDAYLIVVADGNFRIDEYPNDNQQRLRHTLHGRRRALWRPGHQRRRRPEPGGARRRHRSPLPGQQPWQRDDARRIGGARQLDRQRLAGT
jgi:hypothetical protein